MIQTGIDMTKQSNVLRVLLNGDGIFPCEDIINPAIENLINVGVPITTDKVGCYCIPENMIEAANQEFGAMCECA